MKRRLSAALLGCCLVLALLPSPALAAEPWQTDALEAFLHEQIWNGVSPIAFNGADYGGVTETEIRQVFTSLFNTPDMFLLRGGFNWLVRGADYRVTPQYNPEILAEYDAAKARYQNAVADAAALADTGWTDLRKVLFVNDYLSLRFEYDRTLSNSDTYSLIRDGRGVCEAYSLLTMAILEALGVECSFVKSESLNHMWNLVRVDGEWYHLDVTWNDPLPDRPGYARHVYFLLSTDALKTVEKGEHLAAEDWTYGEPVACTSTRYDRAFWRDSRSPFVPAEGKWFFLDGQGLCVWDGESDSASRLLSFDSLFRQWYPGYSFSGYVTNAGLFLYDGRLYLNTAFNVLAFDPYSGETELILDFLHEGTVQSCAARDGRLLVTTSQNGILSSALYDFPAPPPEEPAPEPPLSGFADVAPGSYCFDAVRWAVDRGVTNGTTPFTFSPDEPCSNAQILTFLWRARGSPEPWIANPFDDVTEDRYFYRAALWAYQEGLVSGYIFGGNTPCTRAAAVNFLWKLAGSPPAGNLGGFLDVPVPDAMAVAWAVERGVTKGTTEVTFSPDRICTRGQIVTFLYRDFAL